MQTIAFKVKPDTDLYKNYFSQKKEKAFFNKLARTFLEEHIPEFKMYGLTDRLTVGLSEENARKYQGQLMKGVRYFDGEPLYQFKRSSELDKLWCKQVCARVNGEALYANLWWFATMAVSRALTPCGTTKKGTSMVSLKPKMNIPTLVFPIQ